MGTSSPLVPDLNVRLGTPAQARAAIGARGMNVRLAKQLTGINIVAVEK